jgi:hypothetical protein
MPAMGELSTKLDKTQAMIVKIRTSNDPPTINPSIRCPHYQGIQVLSQQESTKLPTIKTLDFLPKPKKSRFYFPIFLQSHLPPA